MSTYKKQERNSPIPLCKYESQKKSRTFCFKHYFLDFRFLHSLSVFLLPFSLSNCLSSQYFSYSFDLFLFSFHLLSLLSRFIILFLLFLFLRLPNSSLFASSFVGSLCFGFTSDLRLLLPKHCNNVLFTSLFHYISIISLFKFFLVSLYFYLVSVSLIHYATIIVSLFHYISIIIYLRFQELSPSALLPALR